MYRKLIAVFSLSFLIWGVASEPLHAKIKIELPSDNNTRALSQSEAAQLNRNDFNDDPGYVAAVKNAQQDTAITPRYREDTISIGQILYIWSKIITQDRHFIGNDNPLLDPTKGRLAQKIAQYMYVTHDPENSGVVLNNDKTLSIVDPRKSKKRTAEIIRDALFYSLQNKTVTVDGAKQKFMYEFNELIRNIEYFWLGMNPETVSGYDNFQAETGIAPPQFSVVYENGQSLLKYTIPQEQANNQVIILSALPEDQRPSNYLTELVKFFQGESEANVLTKINNLTGVNTLTLPGLFLPDSSAKKVAEAVAKLGFKVFWGVSEIHAGNRDHIINAVPSSLPPSQSYKVTIRSALPEGQRKVNYSDILGYMVSKDASDNRRQWFDTFMAQIPADGSTELEIDLFEDRNMVEAESLAGRVAELGFGVYYGNQLGGAFIEPTSSAPLTPKYMLTISDVLDDGQYTEPDALAGELQSEGLTNDQTNLSVIKNIGIRPLQSNTMSHRISFSDPADKPTEIAQKFANSGYAVTLAERENDQASPKAGTEQFFEPKSINPRDFTKYDKARLIANIDFNLSGEEANSYKEQVAALPNSFKDVLDARKIINFIKKYEVEAKGSPTTTASFQEVNQGLKTQGLVDIVKRIQAAHPGEDVLKWLNNVEEIKSFDDLTPKEIIMANLKYHILHENQEEIEKFKALPDSFDSLDNAKKWVAYIKRFEREIKGNPSDIVALDSLRISGLRQLIKRIIDKYPEENVLGWLESDTVPVASSVSNLLEGLNFAELEERAAYTANTQLLKDAVMAKATENPDLGIKALTQGVNLDTPQENPVAVKDIAEKLQKIAVDQREGVKGLGDGLETTAEALEKKQNASFGWLISSSIKQDEEEAAKDCVERLLQKPKLKAVLQKPRDNYATVMVTRGDSIYEKGSNEPLMTLKKHYCGMALGTLVE